MNYFVYLIPAAVSLFWVVRIFLLKDANRVQLLIIAGMLAAALSIFRVEAVLFPFTFLYLAVRQKVSPSGLDKWDCLMFFPSIIATALCGTVLFNVLLVLQVVAITIWSLIRVNIYGKMLAELYDESEVSAEDIWQVLIFTILSVVSVTILTLLPPEVKANIWVQVVFSAFISVLQFFTGYSTLHLKNDVRDIELPVEDRQDETVAPGTGELLLKRVCDEKLYLDPYLSLTGLAEKLQTNRTYLSTSIHGYSGKNFSDYINTLRVEHFIKLVESDKFTGIKEAAFNSGYNNLQSFYRHFSEIMQMTPKAWISKK